MEKTNENVPPFVSVIEKASTNSHQAEIVGITRLDTSKPLPQDPKSRRCARFLGWIHFVGPTRKTTPCETTVVIHVAFLFIHVGLLSFVARFPFEVARITFACVSGFGFIFLLGTSLADLALRGKSAVRGRICCKPKLDREPSV